jgi:hypothetical protein
MDTGRPIILTNDTSSVSPNVNGKTLAVYHDSYTPPLSLADVSIPFADFKKRCRGLVKGIDCLVFVGLSKAMTPSNRTADVWELLFNQISSVRKISIDNMLFISEPWRSWFHFGFTGTKYRDYTYSFIAESNYKAFVDGVREDNPFALKEIIAWGSGKISCDYQSFFDLEVKVVEAGASVHAEYAELKRAAFDEEVAINKIVSRLSAFAATACSSRNIPNSRRFFSQKHHDIIATDLPIDAWLVSRLKDFAVIVNGTAEAFFNGDGRI